MIEYRPGAETREQAMDHVAEARGFSNRAKMVEFYQSRGAWPSGNPVETRVDDDFEIDATLRLAELNGGK